MIKNLPRIPSSEITPHRLYLNRRQFIKLGSTLALGATLAACLPESSAAALTGPVDELGNSLTSFDFVTNYVNFYEFTTNKNGVAALAEGFTLSPWTIEVGGLVHKPATFQIEDITARFPSEERVYRMRCVEAWSMVIPWQGFELNQLLAAVEPKSSAKYVKFTTIYRPSEMPGQQTSFYPWPYTEGLRLDEAMHPLTILSTGLYGQDLLSQNGAPLRLVVPWKYGFKSIKSIVKIELTEEQPAALWNTIAPDEYGFYANVNPDVTHPRWSQATERPIGEADRKATLLFNGYADQVSKMYSSMDLTKNY